MTTFTGVKDAQYLAQFLGGKIAIKQEDKYHIFPNLSAIFAGKVVQVTDSQGNTYHFSWNDCENPYILLHVEHERIILR